MVLFELSCVVYCNQPKTKFVSILTAVYCSNVVLYTVVPYCIVPKYLRLPALDVVLYIIF